MSNENDKLFLIHIPKTAGSSLNDFFSSHYQINKTRVHLESVPEWNNDLIEIETYDYLSGHVSFPNVIRKISNEWKTVCVFRKPDEHVVSHLSWVRKLGEPKEYQRLIKHHDSIQKIVEKMLHHDLSSANELEELIKWLERENLSLFHNTQTHYLCGGCSVNPQVLRQALKNLDCLDYIGTTERIDELIIMMSSEFGWIPPAQGLQKVNNNPVNYGIDINDPEIRKVLQPLIEYDWIVYERARDIFIDRFHHFLAKLEKRSLYRFSATAKGILLQRINQDVT